MQATIKVTQEHIDKGVPGSVDSCPLALAFREIANRVVVSPSSEQIGFELRDDPGLNGRLDIPELEKVWKFARDFDDGKPVEPFSFAVSVIKYAPGYYVYTGPIQGR